MKDLNFFRPYLDRNKFIIEEKFIYYSIVTLFVLALIIYSIVNQIKIREVSRDILKLREIAEDQSMNKKVREIEEAEKEVKEFKAAVDEIKVIDDKLMDDIIIDNFLLKSITSKIPENMFFTSIDMHPDDIEIVGVARDKETIAELGRSLETIEEFREVFISSISKEDIYFKFILSINLKDVNADEEAEAVDEDTETQEEPD